MVPLIDLTGTLRRLAASITGIGAVATTIAADVAGLDGDAMRGTDDATLQATWTDAMATALANYTAARAAFLDELAAANVPSDVDNLLADTAVLEHRDHSRCRVYPQSSKNTATLTASATADLFGSWAEIVPIDTVDFDYEVVGVVIEAVNAATVYFIQLGYSLTDGDDPTTAQILGERRGRIVTVPIAHAALLLEFYAQNCPANAKLWGRLKTPSVAADEADISVVILRHQEISNPIAPLATWPWSS